MRPALPKPASLFLLLFSLVLLQACGGAREIVHNLNEQEANEILVVLENNGIRAEKMMVEGRVITYSVAVEEADGVRALHILVDNKLPRERSQGLSEVYPPGSGGLIPTQSEEKAKFLMAIQGEIERKLKSFPGIQRAHVSVVIPDREIIRDINSQPPPATASVAIVYNPTKDGEPPLDKTAIQELVAASVEGLSTKHVTVVLKANEPLALLKSTTSETRQLALSGETVLGIKVANKVSGNRAKGFLFGFMALAVVGLILGVFGTIRSISLKGKLSKAEHEVTSLKKARREMT